MHQEQGGWGWGRMGYCGALLVLISMKHTIVAFTAVWLLAMTGCSSPHEEESTDWGFYPTDVEYFPANTFDDLMTPYFGGLLAEMGEPSLLDSTSFPKSAEIYRFTWLSTFNGNLVIRICILADQSATVSVKRYDGGDSMGWRVGTKMHESIRALREDELNQVRSQFASFPYDQMAAWVPGLSGLDGAIWLFEWRTSASPHVIARWSPNGILESFTREEFNKRFPNLDYDKHRTEFTRFADLCTAFSRMADFKVDLY